MSEEARQILEVVRMLVNLIFLIILVFTMADYKIKKGKAMLAIVLTSIFSITINTLYIAFYGIEFFGKMCLFTTTIPFLIVIIIITKDSFSKTMYNFWFQVNIFCIIWMIVAFCYYLFHIDIVFDIIIRVICYLLFALFTLFFIRKPYRVFADNVCANWVGIGLLPMFLTFAFFQNRLLYSAEGETPRKLFQGSIIVLIMILVHYVIIQTYRTLYESMLKTQLEQNMKGQVALYKEQYEAVMQKIEADKVFRHDIRHHSQIIMNLLNSSDIVKAKEYLINLYKDTQNSCITEYSENLVVNSVLSHHIDKAKKQGIEVKCKSILPPELTIDEMEFCVILSNLIENAVQNAVSYIDISVLQNGKQFCINIENDYAGELKKNSSGDYISTTQGGSGIGLKSVRYLVDKQGGIIDILEDKSVFLVRVAINNRDT